MQDVFDKDVFQNDFMGTVSLTVEEIKEASKVFTFNYIDSSFAFLNLQHLFVLLFFFMKRFNSSEDDMITTSRAISLGGHTSLSLLFIPYFFSTERRSSVA